LFSLELVGWFEKMRVRLDSRNARKMGKKDQEKSSVSCQPTTK
jgi:hypothetical protein